MKKLLIIVHSIVILFFTLLSLTLSLVSINLYKKYNNLRMDPLGISNNALSVNGKYDFLLIGDSLIQNWTIDGYSSLNIGIGSQTSSQVLYRSQMLNKNIHSKNTVICVGGNDLKSLRLSPNNKNVVVEKVISNLQGIIDSVSVNSENIYVMTIPPVSSVPFYLKPLKSTNAILFSLNAINKNIINGLDRKIKPIDVADAISTLPKREVYATDNVHLSPKAYKFILQKIEQ